MTKKHLIQLFQERKVRTVWDDQEEKWYFSIVDVCGVLTDQPDNEHARNYWKVLKHRLLKEGNQTVTNCNQLKLRAEDGRMRLTDIITQAWSGKTTRQYKQYKGLKKENLRDNMTNIELALNILRETRPLTICHLLTGYRNCRKMMNEKEITKDKDYEDKRTTIIQAAGTRGVRAASDYADARDARWGIADMGR